MASSDRRSKTRIWGTVRCGALLLHQLEEVVRERDRLDDVLRALQLHRACALHDGERAIRRERVPTV
jgi:hypothetical protein